MFSSLYKIRKEAGILFIQESADLYNVNRDNPVDGDGSTTIFYTEHKYLVDRDDDNDVDTSDVTVYVNGTAVTVSAIDRSQGKITLAVAPALNAVLSVDYAWSSKTDSQVLLYQQHAFGDIISAIGKLYVTPVDSASVNANFANSPAASQIENWETQLAAGYLLTANYTEENGGLYKEGKDRLKSVRSELKAIISESIQLFDSNQVVLARRSILNVSGYPNTDGADIDGESMRFTISKEL